MSAWLADRRPRLQNLQAFHETVGPRMAGFRARVADAELPTGLLERAFELWAAVGQHALQRPAGPTVERHEDVAQERCSVGGGVRRQQCGDAIGTRGIARRDLPHLDRDPRWADPPAYRSASRESRQD